MNEEGESNIKILFSQLKRAFYLAKKNITIYYNKGPVVISGIIFPIVLYLAFSVNRVIPPLYTVSGLLAMILLLTATSVAPIVLPWESNQKTLERLMTTPISLPTLLFGDVLASAFFGLIISMIPFVIGIFLGLILWQSIIFIIAIILGAFCFACFGMILSSPPTDMPANIMIISLLIKFPLLFISPLFIPIKMAPWSVVSPLTYFIDLINCSYSGHSAFGVFGVVLDISVLFGWTVLFFFIGLLLHKKTIRKRFKN